MTIIRSDDALFGTPPSSTRRPKPSAGPPAGSADAPSETAAGILPFIVVPHFFLDIVKKRALTPLLFLL